MLSRPNGELTRAGQYYYQLIGRPPPSRQYDRNQPLIRDGPNDYIMLRGGAKKLLRSLQPNGNYQLTKLGKHFFKDKWVDWVVHVPVIIRGVRRNGRNRGMPYERTKRLPVTDLNVALSRQSEGLADAQAARNLRASVLAQLGNPEPNDIILELSDETYYLDATREWTFSQQAMQVVDDQVVVDTVLDQPLGALRDVSYQLFCGDEILESAFEQRPDKLCVARQLAELMRLPLQEVLSDFDAITNGSKWREQGITPREIRSFCVWRQAPMFYVDCQGRLLDKFEPAIKEQRAVAFTSWNGHAFFYKSARTVARCEPIGDRAQAKYRGERKAGETPEFKDWREWEGEVGSGHFYTEDLEQVRRELLAEGHCPKMVMRSMSEWRCLRLRVRGGEDCVICAFHEELEVLQAWMGRLGLPYRGHLQALCLECHRNKTALEFSHATTLESRFSRRAYEAYVESPRLPPLVFKLNSHKPERICYVIDVVRCRKNALAHSKFPAPIFCPKRRYRLASSSRCLRTPRTASCSWILSSGNLEVTWLSYFMSSVIYHLITSRGRFRYLGGYKLRACSLNACPSTRERTESSLLSILQNSYPALAPLCWISMRRIRSWALWNLLMLCLSKNQSLLDLAALPTSSLLCSTGTALCSAS